MTEQREPRQHRENHAAETVIGITRVTHSCHLIDIGGRRFLTDPWFSSKPQYNPGEPVALSVAELPELDGVLISHEHYDHCDLEAFANYRDSGVALVVPPSVRQAALDHGFRNITVVEPGEATTIGGVEITAIPAKHGVYEITFVLQSSSGSVYFAGDTMLIPELTELPRRFGQIDVALLPINGLCVRPLNDLQVVMNAAEAAELTAVLQPRLAIPHHYAFTSGWLGDRILTKKERNPEVYAQLASIKAPRTSIHVIEPGTRVAL